MLNRRTMLLAPLGMLAAGGAAAKTVTIHVQPGVDAETFIRSRMIKGRIFWATNGETVMIDREFLGLPVTPDPGQAGLAMAKRIHADVRPEPIYRWKTRPDGSVEGPEPNV